jgi:hypothetical protein
MSRLIGKDSCDRCSEVKEIYEFWYKLHTCWECTQDNSDFLDAFLKCNPKITIADLISNWYQFSKQAKEDTDVPKL